jgi:cell division protein FtsB
MLRGILRGRALWVLAVALVVSVFVSGGAVRRYWVRHQELIRLEERRSEMRRRLHALEARRARADHDEAFIETAARRELGLVGPDEIEFRFVDAVSSGSSKPSER